MDANYYHYPGPWIGARPGFMTGGGFPMRFADLDGTPVDIYQQNTNLTDESTTNVQTTIDTLLDNAVGAAGYYGVFGANMHTDSPAPHAGSEAIVSSALARGVPVISYRQLLSWVDGRNSSTVRGLAWNAGTLTFVTDRRRRRERAADDAAGAGPGGKPDGDHAGRLARQLHGADDQGRAVRLLPGRDGHVPGDLRVTRSSPVG